MRPVNLLPEHLRPRERSPGTKTGASYIVIGVLAALLVGVVAYVVTANEITSSEAETERLHAETEAAQARAGALAPFGAFEEMKRTRMAAVSSLASSRFDWERLTRELALAVPGGVWLTDVEATATGAQAASGAAGGSSGSSGSSASSSSSSGAAGSESEPSVSLSGCAPTQRAIAETMVRLRRLHGAEDVDLVSSEREQQASGATSSGSAGSTPPGGAAPTPSSGSSAPPPPSGSSAGAATGCGTKRGRPNYQFEVSVTITPSPDPDLDGRRVPKSLGGGA